MINSPWLERVWTCQEIASARRATVHYGPISCSWNLFSGIITHSNHPASSAKDNHYLKLAAVDKETLNLYKFRRLCKDIVLPRHQLTEGYLKMALDQLTDGIRHTAATDPKDKVFGIYGILQKLHLILPAPDYGKAVRQIYGEAALAIHEKRHDLKFRHYFHPLDNPHNLPSW